MNGQSSKPSPEESTCTSRTQQSCALVTGTPVEAEPQQHGSHPVRTLQLASPALQGDMCLFPAGLGGLITSPSAWHFFIALLSVLQGIELLRRALGLWRTTSQVVLPVSVQQRGQQGSCVLCWERNEQQKRLHSQILSVHSAMHIVAMR